MSNGGLTLAVSEGVHQEVSRLATLDWREPWGDRLETHRSPNFWAGRRGGRVRCVVWHITQGSYESALDWLCSPASDASSHDLISREGRIAHLVEGADTAWCNGPVNAPRIDFTIVCQVVALGINPNTVSYTIECAGISSRGRGGSLTDIQTATLIGRTAQACCEYRLTADHEHILRHGYWDSVNRADCPGYSRAEMDAWIEATRWLAYEWRGW